MPFALFFNCFIFLFCSPSLCSFNNNDDDVDNDGDKDGDDDGDDGEDDDDDNAILCSA